MDDRTFIQRLNRVAAENSLSLPFDSDADNTSAEFLTHWAQFLEMCVREEIKVSDPRWQRVTIAGGSPTQFALEAKGSGDATDDDFKVGLKLLLGILGRSETPGP